MTRQTMRTLLRRFVNDVDSVEWTDAECNEALQESYYERQGEVQAIDPEAVIFWDNMNTTSGTNWYPLPPTFGVISVGFKSASSDTTFSKLDHQLYEDIKDLTGTTTYYTLRGEWLGIFPSPDASVTNGIELLHRPIHTMTVDSDEPKFKLPLHRAIVLGAKLFLLGDTNEESKEDERKLTAIMENARQWYGQQYDQPLSFSPRGL
jgi:hypothetical protein